MPPKIVFAFIACLLLSSWQLSSPETDFLSGFQNPPLEARPMGLWDWTNGNFSLSQITHEMEEAKAKGMGGFDIWDVGLLVNENNAAPAGPAFMGDESVQGIAHAIREAERLKLRLGLITSSSWNAGGSWVKPEHGTMGLFQTTVSVNGGEHFNGQLPFPKLPEKYRSIPAQIERNKDGLPTFYQEVAVLAFNKEAKTLKKQSIIDLTSLLKPDGTLTWKAPAGKWQIVRYVCAPTGQPLMIPSPNSVGRMIDHFSAEATEEHLVYILQKLEKELGSLRNRSLEYLYVDSYEVQEGIWTPQIYDAFQKRWGYDMKPFLPVFSGKIVESQDITDRFLFDYKKLLSDLIITNHYRKGVEVCGRYGLGYAAEAGGPGPPVHNVPFEDLKALGSLTFPRGEFWNNHPKGQKHNDELQIVKGIASAAHIYNQKYVEAEAFTSVWVWQEGPQQLRPLADRAFCEGLNRVVYHTFPHTPAEAGSPGWVYNFGTLIHLNNGWWPKSKAFHEYLARCSYLLQQGHFVGDVAFYYGDQAPNFVTFKQTHPSLGEGYDYDVVNTEAILEKMSVKNGKIVLPHGQQYELLALPPDHRINEAVLSKIEQLVKDGATVVGRKPSRTYGLSNYQNQEKNIRTIANRLWGACDSVRVKENQYGKGKIVWGKSLRQVLQEKGIMPDFESDKGFDYIHRQTEQADIYFVRNTSDKATSVKLKFRATGEPQLWNPVDGKAYSFRNVSKTSQGTTLTLECDGDDSFFIVFQKHHQPAPPTEKERKLIPVASLSGSWEVRFPHSWGAPASTVFPALQSWSEHSDSTIRHFSGVAAYYKTFDFNQPANGQPYFLTLNNAHEITDVWLNGHHLGERCFPPFRYEVSQYLKQGKNYLVVEVASTLNNRMVGDAKLPEAYRRTKSNIQKGPNPWMIPWAKAPLITSGLLGEVMIEK
ncbi:MAG: glycosyl hydrolase [Runella sp.]